MILGSRSRWLVLIALCSAMSPAQMTGHYVHGVEGMRASTLPPPGLYYRNYFVFYNAGRLTDDDGDSLPVGLDLDVFASANRLIWISPIKILGASYGCDAIVPLVSTDFRLNGPGIVDSNFGLGDLWVEPLLLSWHTSRWDAAFGLGCYIPTGEYDPAEPASPGKNFWTGMATFGCTGYIDPAKTWSASILGRYEIHSQNPAVDITPGNDFHFEWALGKQFIEPPAGPGAPPKAIWDLGLGGYAQWQVTDDSGAGITYDRSVHDRVFSVGPELCVTMPGRRLMCHLRSQWEFGAIDRTEGNLTSFVLTTWW